MKPRLECVGIAAVSDSKAEFNRGRAGTPGTISSGQNRLAKKPFPLIAKETRVTAMWAHASRVRTLSDSLRKLQPPPAHRCRIDEACVCDLYGRRGGFPRQGRGSRPNGAQSTRGGGAALVACWSTQGCDSRAVLSGVLRASAEYRSASPRAGWRGQDPELGPALLEAMAQGSATESHQASRNHPQRVHALRSPIRKQEDGAHVLLNALRTGCTPGEAATTQESASNPESSTVPRCPDTTDTCAARSYGYARLGRVFELLFVSRSAAGARGLVAMLGLSMTEQDSREMHA